MFCCRSKRSATGHPPLPSAAESLSRKPIVCYVTDGNSLAGSSRASDRIEKVLRRIRDAVAAGIDWVQIREKDLEGRDLLTLARGAVAAATESGSRHARVIVNDRLDVALAAGAAGVHLGGESLPARDVIRWCGEGRAPDDFLVGVSCHSLEQARDTECAGASYVFFGPVFDTPSKRPFGAPQGLTKLAEVCRAIRIPAIAIGGINPTNAAGCFQAGAAGIAAIRLFQDAPDAEQLRRTIGRLLSAE
jgi:thiamine-phosphate pyrophosphorylase